MDGSGDCSTSMLIFSMSPVGLKSAAVPLSLVGIMFGRQMLTRIMFSWVLSISTRAASRRWLLPLHVLAQCSSISLILSLPDLRTMVPRSPLPTGLVMSTE